MLLYKCRCEFAIPFCDLQGPRGIERDKMLQNSQHSILKEEVDNIDALQL